MPLECAQLSGQVIETKKAVIDQKDTGIIVGHIASWQPDAYIGIYGVPDRIVKGAYTASIQDHKARNNRQVRFKREHQVLIGGFPIDTVREDNIGLLGEGHVDLNTQIGQETYSLASSGVLVDFSVGHIVTDDEIVDNERVIKSAKVIEGSITEEPKNQRANVQELKGARFADLPCTAHDHPWNEESARARVMELKFADGNGADAFVGGRIIADVIDGRLMVVPAAVRQAAEEIKNSDDKTGQSVIERYMSKLEIDSPFENKTFYSVNDVEEWTNADFKNALLGTGCFSNGAVRALVARSKGSADVPPEEKKSLAALLERMAETNQSLKG